RPAEFRVNGYNAGSRKHPPSAAHVEFESHNPASAADSSPGQIAFVMFEIRDDLVLPLKWHRNIILTHISSDRKFGACEHRRRCDEKNTEQSRFQHLQPKPRDDAHTTTRLAAAMFERGIVSCKPTVRLAPRGHRRQKEECASSTLSDSIIRSIRAKRTGQTRAGRRLDDAGIRRSKLGYGCLRTCAGGTSTDGRYRPHNRH